MFVLNIFLLYTGLRLICWCIEGGIEWFLGVLLSILLSYTTAQKTQGRFAAQTAMTTSRLLNARPSGNQPAGFSAQAPAAMSVDAMVKDHSENPPVACILVEDPAGKGSWWRVPTEEELADVARMMVQLERRRDIRMSVVKHGQRYIRPRYSAKPSEQAAGVLIGAQHVLDPAPEPGAAKPMTPPAKFISSTFCFNSPFRSSTKLSERSGPVEDALAILDLTLPYGLHRVASSSASTELGSPSTESIPETPPSATLDPPESETLLIRKHLADLEDVHAKLGAQLQKQKEAQARIADANKKSSPGNSKSRNAAKARKNATMELQSCIDRVRALRTEELEICHEMTN